MLRYKPNTAGDYFFMPHPVDTLNVLCAQLTRDLFAIARFLLLYLGLLDGGVCLCLSSNTKFMYVYVYF